MHNAPVAIASLEGQRLEFHCLDGNICLPDIDLRRFDLLEQPYVLDVVYYWDTSSAYAMFYAMNAFMPFQRVVIHINPHQRRQPGPKSSFCSLSF